MIIMNDSIANFVVCIKIQDKIHSLATNDVVYRLNCECCYSICMVLSVILLLGCFSCQSRCFSYMFSFVTVYWFIFGKLTTTAVWHTVFSYSVNMLVAWRL
jgi:hypothetical protein